MPGMHGGIAGAVVQESNDYKHPPTPRTPAEDTPAARFKRLPKDDVLFLERLFSEFDVDESGGLGREQTGQRDPGQQTTRREGAHVRGGFLNVPAPGSRRPHQGQKCQ